ncbi:HAD-like domain-containing protein [Mycotypha africana]|uniref:HAD-like domain-containing protein n=1 Tax=Mycotypha africana TaxID=64632 RepID=UPI0023013535|nr:HAD-like domain-containing protein [Mycotypha africana]KAI8967033.1 HAD-like domain-containing protein [Mycotypha africana]
MTIKAVIFDIGGVCVGSPMAGIRKYEIQKGLPRNYINVAIVNQGENGAFQKLERGEIKLEQFYKDFSSQLSDPANKEHYKKYIANLRGGGAVPETIPDVLVDGKALFITMMSETAKLDPHIYTAIQKLKASNHFKLAALTNNFELPEDDLREAEALGASATEKLRNLFDYFIESRLIGLRKPDPKIYQYACNLIGIKPEEAIFLDDIGMNLRSAHSLGMKTIQVKIGYSREAVQQLEKLTGLDLHSRKHGTNL